MHWEYDYDDAYEDRHRCELEQRIDEAGELMLGLVKELTGSGPINVQHVHHYLSEICHHLRVNDGSDPVTISRDLNSIEAILTNQNREIA